MLHLNSKTLTTLGLLNLTGHDGFDRQTRLARLVLKSEASLMTIIDDLDDRQFLRSTCGVAEPLCTTRATPLSHSFCKLVRDGDEPLIVVDARLDDRVKDNPAVTEFGVISYLGAPIHDPTGRPIGALCVFNTIERDWQDADISLIQDLAAMVDDQILLIDAIQDRDLAMAEAGREANVRANFVASIGHEVRTPLHGVMGLAHVMADNLDDPAQQVRIQTIIESSDVMLHLLDNLLDLSKIEAGKLEIVHAPFRPVDLANKLESIYLDLAERKGLILEVLTSPAARNMRAGDVMRINQILQNLVNNAIKFTEAGKVTVRFNCDPGKPLRVSVSDTGIGMSAESAAKLFKDYVQVDATISHRFGGTGLGLAIVRHLVTSMGGTISVNTVEGTGTEFKVVLPLAEVDEPKTKSSSEPILPHDLSRLSVMTGMRVLAVDDVQVNLIVIKAMLTQFGFEVDTARDGVDAVAMVQTGGYSAVFMDISMPRMDGVQAALAIRAAELGGNTPPIPLIAVTANTQPDQIRTYRNSGFDDVICKPIQMGEITRAVRKYVLLDAAHAIVDQS